MDFETYVEELAYEMECGINEGISQVMRWLESGRPLNEYLRDLHPISFNLLTEKTHWGRIAKSLGREEEIPQITINKKYKSKTKQ